MRTGYLVDTHSFLWCFLKQPGLSPLAISILEDGTNELFLSAATCWEMLIKCRIGNLSIPLELATDMETAAVKAGFNLLPITFAPAQRTGLLPRFQNHKDPLDRLLIAQALVEGLILLSNGELFSQYGVLRSW